jgi:hypothetical protein
MNNATAEGSEDDPNPPYYLKILLKDHEGNELYDKEFFVGVICPLRPGKSQDTYPKEYGISHLSLYYYTKNPIYSGNERLYIIAFKPGCGFKIQRVKLNEYKPSGTYIYIEDIQLNPPLLS